MLDTLDKLHSDGIWKDPYTRKQRAEMEWPPLTIRQLASISALIAEELHTERSGFVPIVVQIGPSVLDGTSPELDMLLSATHPSTGILSIDIDGSVVSQLKKKYETNARVTVCEGDGWHVLDTLISHHVNADGIRGNVAAILAANNLAYNTDHVKTYRGQDKANELIFPFLDTVSELLHPRGEAMLFAGQASLRIGKKKNLLSSAYQLTIPSHGIREVSFEKDMLGEKTPGVSHYWEPWVMAIRQYGGNVPLFLKPEYVPLNAE